MYININQSNKSIKKNIAALFTVIKWTTSAHETRNGCSNSLPNTGYILHRQRASTSFTRSPSLLHISEHSVSRAMLQIAR